MLSRRAGFAACGDDVDAPANRTERFEAYADERTVRVRAPQRRHAVRVAFRRLSEPGQ